MQAGVTTTCRGVLLVVVLSLVAAACGGTSTFSSDDGTASEVAEALIETQAFAQRLGVDQMTDAACLTPPTEQVGEQFVCTAQLPDDAAAFTALIDSEDMIFVDAVNIVPADRLRDFASDAIGFLNQENGFTFPEDALDCGSASVVLDDRQAAPCVLTDPESGVQFETTLQINTRTGAVAVEVGEPIGS